MDKLIIALGGGELKTKTTLEIDGVIAKLAKRRAGEKRAYGLFIGTASHDSMPYFNSFRKTYTSVFDIKADCVLTVYGEMNQAKIAEKFAKADFIYVGGGDTVFMLKKWREMGIDKLILEAYERGVILCGLSAGAIYCFKTMYTDSELTIGKAENNKNDYNLYKAMGIVDGTCSPHFELREADFYQALIENSIPFAYGIESNAALVIKNGNIIGSLSAGGNAYLIRVKNDEAQVEKFKISQIDANDI